MRAWIICIVLVLPGCFGSDGGAPASFEDSFEEGFRDWRVDEHVPDDPNNPGFKVSAGASISDQARSGGNALRFHLDGRQDDGTVWVERTVPFDAGATYRFNVSFWAWSESESFNTLAYAVAYLGPDDPEREEDFPEPMQNSRQDELGFGGLREPLDRAEGWEEYSFTWDGEVPDNGGLFLAIGISAVWETEMQYDLDDVQVTASKR